ncbi:MAG TPA: AsmA-like C-terminal region-containing protein [Ohtaekwangia sp.]|nr:AsmA-like C-terminal region-containing protein [Ohtaekwangia sp.]
MKTLRKIFFYLLLTLVTVLIALVASVFLFREKLLSQFVREANKHLNTPVKIGKMDVSLFENFPQLSIVLTDVYIEDSHAGIYPLFTARHVSFQLNPITVWGGDYTINGLRISDSETNLKISTSGKSNYDILKKKSDQEPAGEMKVALKDVKLTNTTVHYTDINAREDLNFTSKDLLASIETAGDIYNILAAGELTTRLNIDGEDYLAEKSFLVDSDLIYDDANRVLTIKPSDLALKGSSFNLSGTYGWKEKNIIDITATGKDTDIQTLLSLLPESASQNLKKYQSKGEVYFQAKMKGEIGKSGSPSLSVTFGLNDATIFHPEYQSRIEEAHVEGSFASSAVADPKKAVLVLKNVTGKLDDEFFTANLVIHDFKSPEVICNFKGRMNAGAVFGFYPVQEISNVSGSLFADVSFEGKIEMLKKRATARQVSTHGTIDLQGISLAYGKDKVPLQDLRGSLQFSNNDLALSNVSGKLGNSDFLLNGFFKNVITFLLFDNQPIGIEADLKSNHIDLDQLFAIGFGEPSAGQSQQYQFSISRNINLNFNCDVRTMRYKRFHARSLRGDLLVKNEMAVSRNITLQSMGGDMTFSGIVDAKNKKAIDVVSTFKLNGINLDSVFYVFENFRQDFIEDKHLKGRAHADVNLEMTLNQNLRLFSETLVADIGLTVKGGELNNFEPMQKLKNYLDDDGLSKLRFSDLKNDIHIENKTIYIPQMEVRTNVTELKISGTHAFDQRIDYRIITPLRKRRFSDPEALNAMEADGSGQSKLFLKIVGTTDDYRVAYDTEAVRKKIASDLKKEVQELKDAFKNKGTQQKKVLELEKDEYFDW